MEDQNSRHALKTCLSNQAMRNLYEMRENNSLCDATITLGKFIYILINLYTLAVF